ncbi:MAG: response regulator [Myxococcales bacterium]|nr:response regulator [Myxococcales bacterium]
MATKVLVFESDNAFATELRSELGKLGCATTIVDDGNVGLQAAATERPDLILLSIELPRMNGFSVCNKLKKDPTLREVPLIIMSSESSEETFEQHKKLRTRAEDYVHKPIAFGELMRHIQPFVPLTGGDAGEGEGGIVVDDEVQIDDSVAMSRPPAGISGAPRALSNHPSHPSLRAVDAEVDAFAESAFGRLTGSDPPAPPVQPTSARPSVKPPPSVHPAPMDAYATEEPPLARPQSARPVSAPIPESARRDSGSLAAARSAELEHAAERESAKSAELAREVERLRRDNERLSGDLDSMSRSVESAGRGAQEAEDNVGRLQRELEELRGKLATAGKSGGVSAREFLELRENLNRKDKEILQLKETVSRRDKELIESRDRTLGLERTKQEGDDKILAVERQLADVREKNEALAADREQAKKITEETRAKVQKLHGELEGKSREIDELRARHAEEIARSEATLADIKNEMGESWAKRLDDAREEHRRELDLAKEEHGKALEQATLQKQREAERVQRDHEAALREETQRGARERERAVAEREAELSEQYATELASRQQEHQDELAAVRAEHARQLDQASTTRQADLQAAERAAGDRLAVRERELERQHTVAIAAITVTKDQELAQKDQALADAIREKDAMLVAVERDRDERIASVQSERDQQIARLERERAEQIQAIERDRDTLVAALEQDRESTVAAVEAEKNRHIAALEAERDQKVAAAERDRDEKVAAAIAERDQRVGAVERERDQRVADLERIRTTELAEAGRQLEERLASQKAEHEGAMASLQASHGAMVEELESDRDERLLRMTRETDELRATATSGQQRIASLETEVARTTDAFATLAIQKREADTQNAARITALESELAAAAQRQGDVDRELLGARERIATLENDLGDVKTELDALKRRLSFETGRANRAFAKWEEDRVSLDRAKDALAMVLAQIEDAEARSID